MMNSNNQQLSDTEPLCFMCVPMMEEERGKWRVHFVRKKAQMAPKRPFSI